MAEPLSPGESEAAGKAARRRTPRSALGEWGRSAKRKSPVEILKGQDSDPGPRARPDPSRAHVRLGLHLLPGRRGNHGGRPRRCAEHRSERPALRRRAPLQLRRLRRPRPAPDLRHQRLRRDPSGPVRVGREAARGELRDRRAGPRLQASATGAERWPRPHASTGARCAGSPRCARSTSGTSASTSRPSSGIDPRSPRKPRKDSTRRSRRPRARTACGPSTSSPLGQRRAPHHQRPTVDRARRRRLQGSQGEGDHEAIDGAAGPP